MVGVGSSPGGYELLARLGSGGMASLYLARRAGAAGFERLAAVKVVHPHLAEDERFTLMFVDEAKLSSRIQHPNVVRVEDFGEHEGTYYMAMEYVHGCSLAQLLGALAKRSRRLQPPLAVHIAMGLAAGLHAAHDTTDAEKRPLELVHRDVSPQNALLSYSGHVKLIDFGIAKARFRARETKSVRIKGKLSYMAPEQVRMAPLDRRTDVYALGIVLWEMLTMRRYFQADNELALLDMIRAPEPRSPAAYVSLDPELEAVLLSALAADPADRPPSARELRRRLAKACPAALEVDAADLAELLASAMADQRAKLSEKLPAVVTGQLSEVLPAPPGQGPKASLTEEIDLPSVVWREDTFEDTPRPELDEEPASASPVSPVAPPPRIVPASGTPSSGTPPPRSWAAMVAVVAIACGFGLTLALLSPDEPETVSLPATPEAPRSRPAPEAERAPLPAASPPASRPSAPPVAAQPPPEPPPCEEGDARCVIERVSADDDPSASDLARLVDAHLAQGDRPAARQAARRYLALAPRGDDAARMRELLAPTAPARPAPA
ncbi:MAG: serine/threonine protein kinase, partial [Sandaracinaceae bacterium]|nr:serine/threonine protein kinase [Sandaracinaceae bacterium]